MGGVLGKRPRVADASTFTDDLGPAWPDAASAKPRVADASTSTTDLDSGPVPAPPVEDLIQGRVHERPGDGGQSPYPAAVEEAAALADLKGKNVAATSPSSSSSPSSSVGTRLPIASPVASVSGGEDSSIAEAVESSRRVRVSSKEPVVQQVFEGILPEKGQVESPTLWLEKKNSLMVKVKGLVKKNSPLVPLSEKVEEYSEELLKEIKILSASARELKIQVIKVSKVDMIASYVADRKELAKLKEIEADKVSKDDMIASNVADRKELAKLKECQARISPSCQKNMHVGPGVNPTSRGHRKKGFEPVVYCGTIMIPSCSKIGNKHVDTMNELLFEVYKQVDSLLDNYHQLKHGCEFVQEVNLKEYQHTIRILRSTAHRIRAMISDLGVLPISEPRDHWLLKAKAAGLKM